MATYLLTWNPERWPIKPDDVQKMEGLIAATKAGKTAFEDWNTGRFARPEIGDRVFLVRQTVHQGIAGSGKVARCLGMLPHFYKADVLVNTVDVEWDTVLDVADVWPMDNIKNADLGVPWHFLPEAGKEVPEPSCELLERLWVGHLVNVGRTPARETDDRQEMLAEEVREPERLTEGAVVQITVNAYERNPKAVAQCKAHYKPICTVCGFDFAIFYPGLGDGFIHVHHLRALRTRGGEYEIDPIKDLRPVCPNCHAMLHRTREALTIEELRAIVRRP